MSKHHIVQICVIALFSCAQSPSTQLLSGPWSYRSGNESEGRGCREAAGWSHSIPESQSKFLFQKITTTVPIGASLQFMSVDQLVALYVNDSLTFSTGNLDNPAGQLTTGNTLHLVDLPPGQLHLCFKIYAPGAFRALVGDILLGREGVLIRNLIKKEAVSLFLAGIGLFAGFCLVVSFFHSRQETGYMYFGIYLLTTGAWALAQTLSKQLMLQDAYFWRAVDLIALFQIPVWMALFYRRIFGTNKPGIFDAFWILHSLYAVVVYILLLTGLSGPEPMLLPFQISSVALLILMMISSVHRSYSGDIEARLLFSGLVLVCVSGIHDFLNAMGLFPWRAPISVYSTLFPLLSGVIILIRRSFSGRGEALQNRAFQPLFVILQTKFGLTYQEARICCDIAEGKERAALRKDLNIAESTLKSQLSSIYKKTIERGGLREQDRRDKMQRLTVFLHRLASDVQ